MRRVDLMPFYKLEFNFEAEDEREASDIEGACYEVIKSVLGDYKKITMDIVFEIDEEDKDI
jgi:hypothetical protein